MRKSMVPIAIGTLFIGLYFLFSLPVIGITTSYIGHFSKEKLAISDTFSVIGVGDIMQGTNYPNVSYLPPDDGKNLWTEVRSFLQDADLTFGNLEGPLLDAGGTMKQCNDPSKCYAFRCPTRYGKYLQECGFDMMSLANNHCGDFGPQGRESTIKTLSTYNILYAGLLTCPTTIFTKDGVRYGLAAFAPNSGTVNINDLDNARQIVKKLSGEVDIVIVSFHGGAEGSGHQHVLRKKEIYFGENRGNVYAFSRAVIDAGADIVFGHGPHVTRSVDLYKDRFIIYSLGNFCTYGRFNTKGECGLAPLLKVFVNRKGEFLKAEITPIIQIGEGIPTIDKQKQVIQTLQRLLKEDFPESLLNVSDEGLVRRK